MKKYINRNYFWSSLFVNQLVVLGIENVCISPGSRNTPLTLAFAENKKIKKYIHVDERSSAFFALGLAKKTNKPVAVVTTSGTAVAELYPAIIEAYQQRIPLIICTADRPAYLRNTGANQTINQENIFKNHIRNFIDTGLPSISKNKLYAFAKKIVGTINVSTKIDRGPVHINFPFEKPLEPHSFTDEINLNLTDFLIKKKHEQKLPIKKFSKIINTIKKSTKTIILLGWDNYDNNFFKELTEFSKRTNIPILVDGTSSLRFFSSGLKNIIVNHTAFLKNKKSISKLKPDLILQFGNAPTSQIMLRFLKRLNERRILINEFGDNKSSSKTNCKIVKVNPTEFILELKKYVREIYIEKEWMKKIIASENNCETIKSKIINKHPFDLEPDISNRLLEVIPTKSNLFISNSLPIRDFDFFASKNSKQINVFTNRGASGIDGIISTASGIGADSKRKTFLVIGDLAFYHNVTALATLYQIEIPLVIILINNNGGGIFNMLPVASNKKYFTEYFTTKQNLNYSNIVKSFNGNYFNPKSWKTFNANLKSAIAKKTFSVIEIKTDSKKSLELRKKYWTKVKLEIEKNDN